MTETAREAVARAIFDAWRAHMLETGEPENDVPATFDALDEREKSFAFRNAAAAIAALDAHRDTHGWQIVPKEPTPDMADAYGPDWQEQGWADALAAAPKSPTD